MYTETNTKIYLQDNNFLKEAVLKVWFYVIARNEAICKLLVINQQITSQLRC